jgi:hypothetical protein
MKISRSIVHNKIGSLIKGSTLVPEENVIIGYSIKDGDNYQSAAYRVKNGLAKLITIYRGAPPIKTAAFEQAAINWATSGLSLKPGGYYSPYGTLKQNAFGGFLPKQKKNNNFFHIAKNPLESMNVLANSQHIQKLDETVPFTISALDSDWVELQHENTTSHKFPIYVIKRALITRFLTGLNAPAPDLAQQFISAVNTVGAINEPAIIKEFMVKLHDGVLAHVEALDSSNKDKTTDASQKIFIRTNQYQRQKDKLLKLVSFLYNLSGKSDEDRVELKMTTMKRGIVPLLIAISGTPLTVSEVDNINFSTFPHYWTTSPFENCQTKSSSEVVEEDILAEG